MKCHALASTLCPSTIKNERLRDFPAKSTFTGATVALRVWLAAVWQKIFSYPRAVARRSKEEFSIVLRLFGIRPWTNIWLLGQKCLYYCSLQVTAMRIVWFLSVFWKLVLVKFVLSKELVYCRLEITAMRILHCKVWCLFFLIVNCDFVLTNFEENSTGLVRLSPDFFFLKCLYHFCPFDWISQRLNTND